MEIGTFDVEKGMHTHPLVSAYTTACKRTQLPPSKEACEELRTLKSGEFVELVLESQKSAECFAAEFKRSVEEYLPCTIRAKGCLVFVEKS